MDTPIYDFVRDYVESGFSRLHMPGHKGIPFLGTEEYDITEIKGADCLYGASGIIEQSERNASRLFGTKRSLYSTEGSSLCVKAMLYSALLNAPAACGRPVVLAARNAHKSFVYACALLDIDARWMYPEKSRCRSVCSCAVTPGRLERELGSMAPPPFAVYVTSPDYLGGISDVPGLSEVCRRHGVPLLADNAHGAYLKFLNKSRHPADLGACMCCDSAHKTLPVLTGGAYLHISRGMPDGYVSAAESAMAMFGSTSPSYLILQSLDLCNGYIAEDYREKLDKCVSRIDRLKNELFASGLAVRDTEPLKIVIDSLKTGMSGAVIADILRKHLVECEYSDDENVVLMLTPENPERDYVRISEAMSGLSVCRADGGEETGQMEYAEQAMTIREAIFSKHETVSPDRAVGRICGAPTVSCPPAVPIAISGEIITRQMAELFKKYGICRVEVVKE